MGFIVFRLPLLLGCGGMLGARAGRAGRRQMFPAWVRRDAQRGLAKNRDRQFETCDAVSGCLLLGRRDGMKGSLKMGKSCFQAAFGVI